uniref:Uncharacterized protein n=1 Tax=Leersia perrieri TaxID=77586 RepID=A0A0D9VD73_9ORYZ
MSGWMLHRDMELLEGCKKLQTFRNFTETWERQQKQHFQPDNGTFLNDQSSQLQFSQDQVPVDGAQLQTEEMKI